MTTFRSYYFYRLKRSVVLFAILLGTLIFLQFSNCFSIIKLFVSTPALFREDRVLSVAEPVKTVLEFFFGAALLLSFVLPVCVLSPLKESKRRDPFYSLPLGLRKKAAAHMLAGVTVYAALFVIFSASFAVIYAKDFSSLGTGWRILAVEGQFFLGGLGLFLLDCFFFLFAETVFDGALNIVLWRALPISLTAFCEGFLYRRFLRGVPHPVYTAIFRGNLGTQRLFFSFPLQKLYFESAYSLSGIQRRISGSAAESPLDEVTVWLFLLVSALSCVLFFLLLPKRRPEKIGGSSNSLFAYKLLIPLHGALLIAALNVFSTPVVLVLMLAGYVIYRRGFRLKIPDVLCLAGALALALIVIFVPIGK